MLSRAALPVAAGAPGRQVAPESESATGWPERPDRCAPETKNPHSVRFFSCCLKVTFRCPPRLRYINASRGPCQWDQTRACFSHGHGNCLSLIQVGRAPPGPRPSESLVGSCSTAGAHEIIGAQNLKCNSELEPFGMLVSAAHGWPGTQREM